LAESLPRCPNLKELNLSSNSIGDAGAKAVAESLPRCPNLQWLHLDNNSIGDA